MQASGQYLFCGLAVIAGLIIASYLSSLLYFLMAGYDPAAAKPWSVWSFLPYAGIPAIQSRLFVAIGFPCLLLLLTLSRLLTGEEPEGGDARWANRLDIGKAGLFKSEGVILGKYQGRYLMNDDPTHVLCVAPTRSGKGVGLVIPNLLNWPDSLICLDVKHENYRITAGYRQAHGQEVFMWSPLDHDLKSHCYNPLDALSSNPHQKVGDLKVIGKILVQDPNHGDDFWASEARSLFVGLALYVLENPEMPSTIGAINRLLGAEADLGDICRHIVKTHSELPTAGKKTLMSFANKAAKERSGVKSNLDEALQLWDTPSIDAATSRSDFSVAELRKKRMSIYVGVHTGQIATLAPLLRIFFEQVITLLSMKEPDKTDPYKILLMLDEFHMLGPMSAMTTAFTLLGGFNCRVMAIVQGLKWLDVVYGRDKRDGILSCCAHQIFFSANDLETASYISQSCGEKTVASISTSQRKSLKYEPPSQNKSFRSRPLITKEKGRRLPRHDQIVITESSFPVRARKIAYYKDKNFKSRLLAAPDIPALQITEHGIPEFDIPDGNPPQGSPSDPNQTEMFSENKPKESLTTNLTDGNNEPDEEFVKLLLASLEDDVS